MPFFEYQAKNYEGLSIKGTIEAASESAAMEILAEKKLLPIALKLKSEHGDLFAKLSFLNKISAKDLVLFSRQLSVMKSANLPLVQSLRILEKQTVNPKLKLAIAEIADEVDGGARLSQAMASFPEIFSNFFISVIKSGETSGRLDEILNYLADQQEKDYDLMSKIKGAMIYPAFIVGGLVVVGIVMMIYVVPKLTDIMQETGGELPLTTRLLIGISYFLSHYWYVLGILAMLAVVALRFYLRTPQGKLFFDIAKIRLPIFGKLFQRIYLVRFTRSMSTLLAGGVTLVESLKVTGEIVGNAVYQDLVERTTKEVEDGNPVSSVFMQSKEVPVMISHMMSIGEQTGHLDGVLERLTNFYAREIDNLVTNLVSLIEPLIMVVLGVAVGMMVAAIIMPMYNMASSF
jgi:type IV pilus assembly protein PilC